MLGNNAVGKLYLGDTLIYGGEEQLTEIYDIGTYAAAHNFRQNGDTWGGASQDFGDAQTVTLPFVSGKKYVLKGLWIAVSSPGIAVRFHYPTTDIIDNPYTICPINEITDPVLYTDTELGTPTGIDLTYYDRGVSYFKNLKIYEVIE